MMNALEYRLSPEEAAIIDRYRMEVTNSVKVERFVEEVARILPIWVKYLRDPSKTNSYSSFMTNFGYIGRADDGSSDKLLVYRAINNAIENMRSLKWTYLENLND